MWDICFHQNLTDQEMHDFPSLLQLLSSIVIRAFLDDTRIWWSNSYNIFSMKSFFLWSNQCDSVPLINPLIWSSKATSGAISFLWTVGHGKILTQGNI